MRVGEHARLWLLLLALAAAPAAGAGPCAVRSDQRPVALVELYTSSRCGACPAAQRWLSAIDRRFSPDRVIAVSLRFETWQRPPSRASRAAQRVAQRERRLSLLQRSALVLAPQVLLQGREFPAWREPSALQRALEAVADRPARARLALAIRALGPRRLSVELAGRVLEPAERVDSRLYMALVTRDEDAYVAREWLGPALPGADGRIAVSRHLALLPGASAEASAIVAFVQNRRSREILQALLLPACSP